MFLNMTVDAISAGYLICFGIGLLTVLGSFMLGFEAHGDGGHSGSSHGSGHDGFGHDDGSHAHQSESQSIPIFNLNTLLAFLLGFGAAGFIAQQSMTKPALWMTLPIAFFGGLVFSYLIYFVLVKILIRGQSAYLKASDFDLVGVEGVISSTVLANRLGEVSYSLHGSHAAMPAKARHGIEIKKGETVVIIEVTEGVVVVMPREQFDRWAEPTVDLKEENK